MTSWNSPWAIVLVLAAAVLAVAAVALTERWETRASRRDVERSAPAQTGLRPSSDRAGRRAQR